MWGVEFRGLDHCAIASPEHIGQGAENRVHRDVPGAHDADDPLRLVVDFGPGAKQVHGERRAPLLGPHPPADMLPDELERVQRGEQAAHASHPAGAAAEVLVHRSAQRVLVVDDERNAAVEATDARCQRDWALLFERLTLRAEDVEHGIRRTALNNSHGKCAPIYSLSYAHFSHAHPQPNAARQEFTAVPKKR